MTYPIEKTEAEWRDLLASKGAERHAFAAHRRNGARGDRQRNP